MYAHSLSPSEPIWSIKGCQVSFKEPQLENLILSSLMPTHDFMHPSNGRVGGDEYVHSKITSLLASEAEKAKTLRSLAFITFFFFNFK